METETAVAAMSHAAGIVGSVDSWLQFAVLVLLLVCGLSFTTYCMNRKDKMVKMQIDRETEERKLARDAGEKIRDMRITALEKMQKSTNDVIVDLSKTLHSIDKSVNVLAARYDESKIPWRERV